MACNDSEMATDNDEEQLRLEAAAAEKECRMNAARIRVEIAKAAIKQQLDHKDQILKELNKSSSANAKDVANFINQMMDPFDFSREFSRLGPSRASGSRKVNGKRDNPDTPHTPTPQ